MKKFLKGIVWFVVVLAVLAVATVVFLDRVVLHGFNTVVPKVLGVDASLGGARIHALKGYASLKELHIGNPEGFKTDGIFDLGEVTVDVDMASLGSDTIVIDSIKVAGAEVTYEQGLTGNNIGALLDQLSKEEEIEEEEAEEEEKEEGEKKPAKKVIIKKLDVEGTRLNVALTAMMGAVVPVPMPPIHLEGIGEESGGASPIEAVRAIIGGVFQAVQAAVAGAGDLLGGAVGLVGDGAKAVAQGAGAAASAVADGAGVAVGAVADGATATVGAVADGASAVGGAVADGASAVGGAVVDGASAVGGAVADGASAVGGAVVDGASAVGGAVADGAKSVGRFLNPFDGGEEKAEGEE
ncbi:MAG: hypothetical protein IKQ55_09235 [Kiritimatiellae bacterium]|nr:hypothetical protein [Kiritimatiellia bacterium]